VDVEYLRKPVPHLIFRDLFTSATNKKMLDEVIQHKDKFQQAYTGGDKNVKSTIRTNQVLYLDAVFKNRKESFFLVNIDRLFKENKQFREILMSSEFPISDFGFTNTHETQVSRYGDEGQKYDWHLDRFTNPRRHLTMVYYMHKEPVGWSGGEIEFTDSPIHDGKAIEEMNPMNHISYIPENNMGVVFGSNIAHRVAPTTSSKEFDQGRFSANIWIGIS